MIVPSKWLIKVLSLVGGGLLRCGSSGSTLRGLRAICPLVRFHALKDVSPVPNTRRMSFACHSLLGTVRPARPHALPAQWGGVSYPLWTPQKKELWPLYLRNDGMAP